MVLVTDGTEAAASLVEGIRDGDRRSLARAITFAESTRGDHREIADAVLEELLPATGRAVRLGISGPPGVGKSTFIEALGTHLIDDAHQVAVLAVDPSSRRTGGSILGDKTRMEELSRRPEAFIRPSPGRGQLGGVARRTREAMLLCEAFGFDVVIVETIGVGQSEVAVADMVDLFMLLVAPGGGDELQGIKRGIMELADLVVVNKADGDLAPAAGRTRADYAAAVHLLRPKWHSVGDRGAGLLGTRRSRRPRGVGRPSSASPTPVAGLGRARRGPGPPGDGVAVERDRRHPSRPVPGRPVGRRAPAPESRPRSPPDGSPPPSPLAGCSTPSAGCEQSERRSIARALNPSGVTAPRVEDGVESLRGNGASPTPPR